jgi:hypothetical protein
MKQNLSNYIQVYRTAINKPTHSWKNATLMILTLLLLLSELYVVKVIKDSKEYSDYSVAAASPDQLEVENAILGGNATVVSDPNASGGKYVVFMFNQATPTPSPTPASAPSPTSVPSSSVGPRPDPAFPSGTNVVTVDSTVPTNGTDAQASLQAFINKQPDGTTIIFDKTKGGAGTTYTLGSTLTLSNRNNITLWGYNSKLKLTNTGGSTAGSGITVRNGSENIKILGFEIDGPNHTTDLVDLYDYLPGEWSHGINLGITRNITIQDNEIHHVNGDAVYGLARGPGSTSWNDGGKSWTYQGPFELSYNYLHHTGRQGFANMSGNRIYVRYNLFEDIVAWPIDWEDHGTEPFVNEELYITDNIMRRFNWWVRYGCNPTSILYPPTKKLDWSRNWIDGGCMGYGNADIPLSVYQKYGTEAKYPQLGHRWLQIRDTGLIDEVVIKDNKITVGANNEQYTRPDNGAIALESKSNTLTITGNRFAPKDRMILIGTNGTEVINNNIPQTIQRVWYP